MALQSSRGIIYILEATFHLYPLQTEFSSSNIPTRTYGHSRKNFLLDTFYYKQMSEMPKRIQKHTFLRIIPLLSRCELVNKNRNESLRVRNETPYWIYREFSESKPSRKVVSSNSRLSRSGELVRYARTIVTSWTKKRAVRKWRPRRFKPTTVQVDFLHLFAF